MHERVDFGLAAIQAVLAGGKVSEYLPPWYERPGMDDDALWTMLGAMAEKKYPEVKRGR